MFALSIQLGDVAAWVGGLISGIALILTYRLLRATREEQRDHQREQERAQARHVTAWITRDQGLGPGDIYLIVSNSGEEPVYSVRIAVGRGWPTLDFETLQRVEVPRVLGPGYRREHVVTLAASKWNDPSYALLDAPGVEIIFFDARYNHWLRSATGNLTELRTVVPENPSVWWTLSDWT
jgi:hypothetical protein